MLIELPEIWMALINILLWLIIHMGVAFFATAIPDKFINTKAKFYQKKDWEREGLIYERVFKIKSWKKFLPDGSAMFKKGFRKKSLVSTEKKYLEKFYLELCRAELAHWIVILFSPIFFIWNYWWAGIIMIVYAIFANLPCIFAQRYNRIRFKKIFKI